MLGAVALMTGIQDGWPLPALIAAGFGFANIWPLLFSITVEEKPERANELSGLMCMAISGGAIVPLVMGQLVDWNFGSYAFVVPAACFAYLLILSLKGGRAVATKLTRKESLRIMQLNTDSRIVMTLDAGGTNLRFSAIRAGELLFEPIHLPTEADNLTRCLGNIVEGFSQVRTRCPAPPVAISFAFPGPADYPAGIIGDLGNLPCFRGGVALGPMLEEKFGLPTFINNDGDLFAYGEAIAGFLPYVNEKLTRRRKREAVPEPVRHHARHGLRRRDRPQRRTLHRRQRRGRRNLGHARQAAPPRLRRRRSQHPRRAAGLSGQLEGEARRNAHAEGHLRVRHRRGPRRPAGRAAGLQRRWAKRSATPWPTP